jgi:hypothetical protein
MNDLVMIHSYSRADAFDDGFLIDVTETAKEAGFRYPVAVTCAVWHSYVEVPAGVEAQDEAGRLWDILTMLGHAIRRSDGRKELSFQLHVRNDNRAAPPPLVSLKAVCSPDDDGSPCLTIMEPGED